MPAPLRSLLMLCSALPWTPLLAQTGRWSIPFYGTEAAPVAAGGILYAGSSRGELVAVDLATGATLWTHQTGAALPLIVGRPGNAPMANGDLWPARRVISVAPLVDSGAVYVASEDRTFAALDARSGAVLWQVDLPRASRGAAAAGDRVVLGAGNTVVAYSRDGRRLWAFELYPAVRRSVSSLHAPTVPVVNGDLVYVGVRLPDPGSGGLPKSRYVALEISTGALRWSYVVESYNLTVPEVTRDLVYLTATWPMGIHAIDARTGARRWIANAGDCTDIPAASNPVPRGGRVVFATDCVVLGLAPATGRRIWTVPGYWSANLHGEYAAAASAVLVYARNGVSAIGIASGRRLWTADLHRTVYVQAVDTAFAYLSADSSLVALDMRLGRTRWQIATRGRIASGPLLIDGRACFSTGVPFTSNVAFAPVLGELACVDARTGER